MDGAYQELDLYNRSSNKPLYLRRIPVAMIIGLKLILPKSNFISYCVWILYRIFFVKFCFLFYGYL